MAFFVELTEGNAASSKKNIFDAATVVAFQSDASNEGTDLLIGNGDYSSGGKTVHVQETPSQLLSMTGKRVNFVALTEVGHKENGFFYSAATGQTTVGYFNAAAVTGLIPTPAPIPGKEYAEAGDSTIVQLSSGRRAHVTEKPLQVAQIVNAANGP